jgi:hypothetical protein
MRRVSSSALAAAASIAVLACGRSDESSSAGPAVHPIMPPTHVGEPSDSGAIDDDAAVVDDASPLADAAPPSSDASAEAARPPPGPGTFACGDAYCDLVGEYCISDTNSAQCVHVPRSCADPGVCSCLELSFGGTNWQCRINQGAVMVTPK